MLEVLGTRQHNDHEERSARHPGCRLHGDKNVQTSQLKAGVNLRNIHQHCVIDRGLNYSCSLLKHFWFPWKLTWMKLSVTWSVDSARSDAWVNYNHSPSWILVLFARYSTITYSIAMLSEVVWIQKTVYSMSTYTLWVFMAWLKHKEPTRLPSPPKKIKKPT